MIQKFKMTTFAAVLCLFGFMLFSAAPVYADRQENFQECKDMKWTEGKKAKKNCFRDLAEELLEINENLRTGDNDDASSSDGEGRDMCEMLDAQRTQLVTMKQKIQFRKLENAIDCTAEGRASRRG